MQLGGSASSMAMARSAAARAPSEQGTRVVGFYLDNVHQHFVIKESEGCIQDTNVY